jgi:hypothetical protein
MIESLSSTGKYSGISKIINNNKSQWFLIFSDQNCDYFVYFTLY